MTCISQMPTLKMKRKSSTACVKGHSLHSCQKSTKVSKVSFCEVKAFQQSVLLNDSSQSHDVSSNIEESDLSVDINEANNSYEKSCGASPELLNLSSSLPSDPYPSGQVESLSATCQSDLKTIFSPNFEYDDALIKMTNHSDAVRDEQTELPHLIADDSEDGSCTSSDFQSYSELDFYISENAAASSLDFINSICPDFDSMNSNMMMDMTERYMFLPFLEKTVETSIHDEDWVNGAITSSDDACLYLAIHHSDQEEMDCIELSEAVSSICPIWLPKEAREKKHITLVLDLDETLVHSTLEHCTDADFTFPVFFDMKQHTVYVRRRPYLQMFLERVAQLFKVIIFTASQSIYAEQLLDILDPCRNLISQRIYRESCIFSDGTYTKDLTILGVDLAKVAIIDNSPQVFRLQVNNGIPIKSWFDDPSDCALVSLLPFLESLADAEDVRPIISEAFGGKE